MAKNQKFAPSRTRSLPVADGTVSGSPVIVGSLVGVALTDKGAGGNDTANATVALDGAFDLAVGTTTALDVGDPVYIVISSGALTTTDNTGANPVFGYALEAKGTTAGEVIAVEIAQV
jgi:predicted RecA/RadA family phage recombinase